MNALKLTGAVIIAACGFALGQKLKAKEKRHAEFINGMALSIKKLVSEISFLHTPPLDIFAAFSRGRQTEAWFYTEVISQNRLTHGTVAELWGSAAKKAAWEFEHMEEETLEIIRVGEVFGRFD
jgi:hypothetical protein